MSARDRCPGHDGWRIRSRLLVLLASLALAACQRGGAVDRQARDASDASGLDETPAGAAVAPADGAAVGRIAVTIDDLPWAGPVPPGESRVDATRRLLATLHEHDVVATAFVNCARTSPDDPVLRAWLDAGMDLGNHTDEHLSLNSTDPAVWIAGARGCHAFIQALTGDSVVHFRYPYLQRGRTRESYAAARQALDSLGAPIAPVTIDTSDWILVAAYADALRAGDEERERAIGAALVEHMARQAAHYREIARERLGRDVAHVLLLHANAVEADYLGAVLDRLKEDGFRFVTLEEALEDPVYDLPDDYLGPEGRSWLYRIEPAMPELAAWDDAEAERLEGMFRR